MYQGWHSSSISSQLKLKFILRFAFEDIKFSKPCGNSNCIDIVGGHNEIKYYTQINVCIRYLTEDMQRQE